MKKEDMLHGVKIAAAVICIILVLLASYLTYWLGREVFSNEGVSRTHSGAMTYDITVRPGTSAFAIGAELKKNGIINSGLAFAIQTKVFECRIDPGTYTVNSRQSSRDIAKYLNAENASEAWEKQE